MSGPRATVVLLDTGTPTTGREIYSEDADGETRACEPWITKQVFFQLSKTAQTLLLSRR